LCLAAANLARAQLVPPKSAYEWSDAASTTDATDAANWHSPDGSAALPTEGAHLIFGNRPVDEWNAYEETLTGLGDAPMPSRFASLWFGFGKLGDILEYTLTGSAITVGYGTDEIDRLIVTQGLGLQTFDLDILIHNASDLAFRIHNEGPTDLDGFNFAQTLTSHGTLIISGPGYTSINELHGTGELIKEDAGLLLADAANYTGKVIIRDGALVGALNTDSALTLAGGVYGLPDATGYFERDLGEGAGKVRWLAGKSGGFTALNLAELHITLDGGRTLTWGETDFVSLGSELLFGSETADGSLYWHNALDLGDPGNGSARTIRLNRARSADFELYLSEQLIAAKGQRLRFIGNGTVVVSADNSAFLGTLEIAGVELAFEEGGHFGQVAHLTVSEGGTLAISFEPSGPPPLSGAAAITLSSGTLRWDDPHPAGITRTLGDILLGAGANRIERTSLTNGLRANSLVRADSRSTLLVALLANASPGASLLDFDDVFALESTAIGGIHPWLVTTVGPSEYASRSDWGIFEDGELKPYVNYHSGNEATWNAGHNINVSQGSTVSLSDNRTINSLNLDDELLHLEGHTLTIGSGGILVNSRGFSAIYAEGNGSTFGAVTTAGGRPLYIHTHGQLNTTAQITGGIDLVKTGASPLSLSSQNYDGDGHTNELGSIYIHQGDLYLDNSARISTTGTIYVGDGGSYAAFVLENYADSGTPMLSGKRDIRLRGSHDSGKTAKLHLVGDHDLRLNHLSIEGNSILQFDPSRGGGLSKIYSEVFTIALNGRLLVRGWVQEEASSDGGDKAFGDRFTHILVRKTSPGLDDYLRQIWFEDYGPAKKIEWAEDNRYWEIVPGFRGWADPAPEPSTYGAILGAVGLGLVLWRRRKHQGKCSHASPSTGA